MKNLFKRKKEKFPTSSNEPRQLDEIQKEYNEVALKAGQLQYQVFVHSEDLKATNQRLVALNQEAAKRLQLDKEAKAAAATQETAKAVANG